MITIGINEGVILRKVEIVEKEQKYTVDFTLAEGVSESGDDELSFLDEKYDDSGMLITSSGNGRTIKVWPLKVPDDKGQNGAIKTMQQRIEESFKATQEMQNMFAMWAKMYLPASEVKFERFRGMPPLDRNNMSCLLDEKVLVNITLNLANQFIAMTSPFFNKAEHAVRVLLKRQSKAKAFPAFRDKFINEFPFVELMAVPKASSKLAFTKYEITNGFDSATEVGTTDATPQAAPEIASLFGDASAPTVDLSAALNLNVPTAVAEPVAAPVVATAPVAPVTPEIGVVVDTTPTTPPPAAIV